MEFSIIFEAEVAHGTREEERAVIREGVDQAVLAEEMGFDRFWAVEHHSLEWYAHMSAPEIFLTYVAAKTTRLRVGHGVVCLPFAMNHPIRVAERSEGEVVCLGITGILDPSGSLRADCFAAPIYNFDPSYLYPANSTTSLPFITNAAAAFGTPAAGKLGTCGRNSARLPGLSQWDLNILKSFRLSAGSRIEARWEIFNLLNRVNLGNFPTTNTRSGSFAVINSTPDVDSGNPVIAQGGPRAMQWALKIIF